MRKTGATYYLQVSTTEHPNLMRTRCQYASELMVTDSEGHALGGLLMGHDKHGDMFFTWLWPDGQCSPIKKEVFER